MTSIGRRDENAFHRRVGHASSSATGSVSNFDDDILSPLGTTSSRNRPRANSLHYQYTQFDITSSLPAIPDIWTSSSTSSLFGRQHHHRTSSVSSSTSGRSRPPPMAADHSIISSQSSPISTNHVIRSPRANGRRNDANVSSNGSDDITAEDARDLCHVKIDVIANGVKFVVECQSSVSFPEGPPPPTRGDLEHRTQVDTEGPPSPTRGDLERRLAEREEELRNVRETMERNELAIMQVVEEQRKLLTAERRKELDSTRDSERLKRENKYLRTMLRATREQLETTRERLDSFKNTLANSNDDVRLSERITEEVEEMASASSLTRSVSSSTLQDALPDDSSAYDVESNADNASKTSINHRPMKTPRGTGNRSSLHGDGGDACRRCFALSVEVVRQSGEFDRERSQWIHEKRLVIEYQKLLQVGLVRFMNRCRLLEKQLLLLTDSLVDNEDDQLLDGVGEAGRLRESDC